MEEYFCEELLPFIPGVLVSGRSDVGKVRKVNEDSFAVSATAGLLVVADGIGGHGQGDRASSLAVHTMTDSLRVDPSRDPGVEAVHVLEDAVRAANECIYAENQRHGITQGSGMGTTLSGLWISPEYRSKGLALIFSVGDSRVYRLRRNTLEQLTRDHSLYQEWLDSDRIRKAPPRNVITRSVGIFPEVKPDMMLIDILKNDVFVICSDGLTSMVDDDEILGALSADTSVCRKSASLVATAIDRGGRDNVTVIVAACR
ncbi:MAG: PP2C family protein-serine/threonine phosphatase [Alphaproteobacteria bacterium]